MGHGKVAVLDGGLPKWKRKAGALEKGARQTQARTFHRQAGRRRSCAISTQVKGALGKTQMLDARSASRFNGERSRAARRPAHPATCRAPPMCLGAAVLTADGTLERRCVAAAALRRKRRRSARAHHHQLRLRHFRRHPDAGAGRNWARASSRSMTAPGRNGAGATTRRSRRDLTLMSVNPSARRIPMTVTFLEMTAKPSALPPPMPQGQDRAPARLKIRRSISIAISTTRSAANISGWTGGRSSDDKLAEIIQAPHQPSLCSVHGWKSRRHGRTGFPQADGSANIAYFGLMPEAMGKRLGFFFLYHTCMNAWAQPISRLPSIPAPWTIPGRCRFISGWASRLIRGKSALWNCPERGLQGKVARRSTSRRSHDRTAKNSPGAAWRWAWRSPSFSPPPISIWD